MAELFIEDALTVQLKYSGSNSDEALISLYDLSQAIYGFERSLALTTHLILNGEVITQATALKGAQIFCRPPEKGSFSILAAIALFAGGTYKLTTLKKDNPLGHIVHSTYDYLIHKATGQAVDYNESLRETYERSRVMQDLGLTLPRESQLDFTYGED